MKQHISALQIFLVITQEFLFTTWDRLFTSWIPWLGEFTIVCLPWISIIASVESDFWSLIHTNPVFFSWNSSGLFLLWRSLYYQLLMAINPRWKMGVYTGLGCISAENPAEQTRKQNCHWEPFFRSSFPFALGKEEVMVVLLFFKNTQCALHTQLLFLLLFLSLLQSWRRWIVSANISVAKKNNTRSGRWRVLYSSFLCRLCLPNGKGPILNKNHQIIFCHFSVHDKGHWPHASSQLTSSSCLFWTEI